MEDYWKHVPVEGFSDRYLVSRNGEMWSVYTNKPIKLAKRGGYSSMQFYKQGIRKNCYIHVLMAKAFIPCPGPNMKVNHINGIKTDNRIENLEWRTSSGNAQHAVDTGLKKIYTRPVSQYNSEGDIISSYPSIKSASEATGVDARSISAFCKGQRTTQNGIIWLYDDVEDFPQAGDMGKQHPRFPNYYVTPGGKIYSVKAQRYMKPNLLDTGYLAIQLSINGFKQDFLINRLVAEFYIPPIPGKDVVNHINTIKTDNRMENLEWNTYSENTLHAVQTLNFVYKHGILQYNLNNELCGTYESIREANRQTGYNRHNISKCCKGEIQNAHNFIWRYNNKHS